MLASPLRTLHQHAEAAMAPYGPPEAGILVVQTYGELELEYAALRKSCVLIDRPERAILEITGPDRIDFLNRMLTQDLKTLTPGHLVHAFWLNRKGRIDADITLIHLDGRTYADLDALAAQRTIEGLSSFIITEDVSIADATSRLHRLSLHGPTASALLPAPSLPAAGAIAPATLADRTATRATVAGNPVTIYRDDAAGEPGFEIILNADHALAVFQHLIEIGHDQHNSDAPELGTPGAGLALHSHRSAAHFRLRPAGWHAYNIARIEAGTPLYNIDFGPDSLPHETGDHVLHDRVSFTKGCYLGQEIVARMPHACAYRVRAR
ncbi:hypothetical protein J4558_18175 [Leptolyngbya sp. 15MV]|nr:hypothetical protein J4558_18175 [Leptolyngbya sp. 15MV]